LSAFSCLNLAVLAEWLGIQSFSGSPFGTRSFGLVGETRFSITESIIAYQFYIDCWLSHQRTLCHHRDPDAIEDSHGQAEKYDG
jgi:hypothetical protein